MKLPKVRQQILLAAIGCGTFTTSAQATGVELITGQLAGAIQMMVASQNLCVHFTYDQNGNRITQTSNTLPATPPAWGAATYPCFIWGN